MNRQWAKYDRAEWNSDQGVSTGTIMQIVEGECWVMKDTVIDNVRAPLHQLSLEEVRPTASPGGGFGINLL